MKRTKVVLLMLTCLLIAGCRGIVKQAIMNVDVGSDLSGGFVLEAQVTKNDIVSYAERRSTTDPITDMAHEIAGTMEWSIPYEVSAREDGETVWIQLGGRFSGEDAYCALLPDASQATIDQGNAALGVDDTPGCRLERVTTAYTDLFIFEDTVYPGDYGGGWTIRLPGSIIETNGSVDGDGIVNWRWSEDSTANVLHLVTGGLADFSVRVRPDLSSVTSAKLVLEVTASSEVLAKAATIYGDNAAQAVGQRVASGLNLPSPSVTIGGGLIKVESGGMSPDELAALLNSSGLMSGAQITVTPGLFQNEFEISGTLVAPPDEPGYPTTVELNLEVPGQSEPQTWSTASGAQTISAKGSAINWLGVAGVGAAACIAVVGGVAVLGGGAFLAMRRKKSQEAAVPATGPAADKPAETKPESEKPDKK